MSEADHLMAGPAPVLCECGHLDLMHTDRHGQCNGLDSYDCPCACSWLEEWAEDYTEEDDY